MKNVSSQFENSLLFLFFIRYYTFRELTLFTYFPIVNESEKLEMSGHDWAIHTAMCSVSIFAKRMNVLLWNTKSYFGNVIWLIVYGDILVWDLRVRNVLLFLLAGLSIRRNVTWACLMCIYCNVRWEVLKKIWKWEFFT